MATYRIKAFAALTGTTPRALRYYHELGLVVPKLAANGYREYTSADADRLQRVLMLQELGFPLREIATLLDKDSATLAAALKTQAQVIADKQQHLADVARRLDATLQNLEGDNPMPDNEKFAAFKDQQIATNDEQFGQEVVAKYGKTQKQAADAHWRDLSKAQYAQLQTAEQRLKQALIAYLAAPVFPGADARAAFEAHRQWLRLAMPNYTPAIHRGLADLYAADSRFAAYYTKLVGNDAASPALVAIIRYYA
ncbi:MerR family transcriptional regulator [Lacticaseibacillus sp. GG6-2]